MKAVISKGGKNFQREIDENIVYGKKIGDKIDGSVLGLNNYELEIVGGSDKDGFPMRKGVHGTARKKLLLSSGVGYRQKRKGIRRRKSIRGEVVSEETAQLNLKVVKEGDEKFEQLLKGDAKEDEEKSEEQKTEENPKEEVKAEEKKE